MMAKAWYIECCSTLNWLKFFCRKYLCNWIIIWNILLRVCMWKNSIRAILIKIWNILLRVCIWKNSIRAISKGRFPTFASMSFSTYISFSPNYVVLGGHILNISQTVFPTLIFQKRFRNQLPDVLFQMFYIYSTYVINYCI